VQKRDLRLELLKAEEEARAKKRKAGGFVGNTENEEESEKMAIEDRSAEEVKRRRILQDIVLDEDKDDEDEDEDEEEDEKGKGKGKQVAMQER
jgi:protein CWC15